METKTLVVNGIPRQVLVDSDTLLVDVLRNQLQITSVKVGCGQGQCGACSVILDGKVTRACIVKMRRVPDQAQVTTLEGVGTPANLHPLQESWMFHGAAQCGFCTPGFIVSAKALLDACGYTAAEIGTDKLAGLPGVVRAKGAGTLCEALGVGEPTLNDIVAELCKPGRDVRDSLPKPLLRSDVMGLDDLKPGMELTGTVRNVIDFGAFVDLGVHQDGLVHVSQISDKFIKHPREVLKVGDIVRVKVLNVDTAKKRIALTMKGVPQQN